MQFVGIRVVGEIQGHSPTLARAFQLHKFQFHIELSNSTICPTSPIQVRGIFENLMICCEIIAV